MKEISWILFLGLAMLTAIFLTTPYESVLEVVLAVAFVAAVVVGFLLHPRRDVFYVRTTIGIRDTDRRPILEHDYLAVKVEVTRLWLLFLPTLLAVGFLVVSAANGSLWKFSFLNRIVSSKYAPFALVTWHLPSVFVLVLLSSWISERWVMRDAEACSARSYSVTHRSVAYLFMGERGEYYGGHCYYFGLVRPMQLATIVFHNARKPELNKIAMGFLFHRMVILGRGVTELDKQTVKAQRVLLKRLLDRWVTNASARHRRPSHDPNRELWIHPEFKALQSGSEYGCRGPYIYDCNSNLCKILPREIVRRDRWVQCPVLHRCTACCIDL